MTSSANDDVPPPSDVMKPMRSALAAHAQRGSQLANEIFDAIARCDAEYFHSKDRWALIEAFALVNLYGAIDERLADGVPFGQAVDALLQSKEWGDLCAVYGWDDRRILSACTQASTGG